MTSSIPEHWALFETDLLSEYLIRRFEWIMDPKGAQPLPPVNFPVHVTVEAERILVQLKQAMGNQSKPSTICHPDSRLIDIPTTVQVSWDAVRYSDRISPKCNGQNASFEEQMKRNFPPIMDPAVLCPEEPTVIVDRHHVVLAWYLPFALTRSRQVRLKSPRRVALH